MMAAKQDGHLCFESVLGDLLYGGKLYIDLVRAAVG
jgi:hypothetical protein